MTLLLLLVGLLLIAVTVRLAVHAAVLPRLRLTVHLRELEAYGFEEVQPAEAALDQQRLSDVIDGLAEQVGRTIMRAFPLLTPVRRGELTAAAFYDASVETVHGYRALAALVLPGLILFVALISGGPSPMTLLFAIGLGAAGWYLPALFIRKRGERRMDQIDRELPDLIDLLTATVEAGMGFAASIDMIAGRFKGALGDELRLTHQQQKLGISTDQALKDMVERCDTPSMRSFVRTLRAAESLGVSIGSSMRELAHDVRRRRRQTAQERMQKAPVKLLFPLMIFIFPALMVELLYPAAYSFLHILASSG